MSPPFPTPGAETLPAPRRLSAEQVIRRLKFLQAYEIFSSRLLGGWMAGIANWEIKHEIGLHLWQDAEASRDLRTRLWELRISKPDREFTPALLAALKGFAGAQADYEFLAGLYWGLKTELVSAYESIVQGTSDVYDAPTIAIIQRILPAKQAQLRWADTAVKALINDQDKQARVERWMEYCRQLMANAGGLNDAAAPAEKAEEPVPPPGYSPLLPFPQAIRDERFHMSFRGMDMPPAEDREASRIFQFFNYSQEMQASETLGTMMWEVDGMEWEFYFDVARHCYDEIRHSSMGEARLRELGHKVTDFPNCATNYAWRQMVDPLRRYCVLTCVIEADGFKYKHETYQGYLKSQDLDSAEAVLYDIIDETMHVRMGQKWVPKLMERFEYREPLEHLISECRDILLANSVSPTQRMAAAELKARS